MASDPGGENSGTETLIVAPLDGRAWRHNAALTARHVAGTMRANWKRTLVCALAGWGIGWLANVWVMARKYDGFRVPSGSTVTGEGNVVAGTSFWFLLSMVVSALVCYRIQAGSERFWADVRTFPETIRGLARSDGDRAKAHALFGFAGATLLTYMLGPSLSGAVGVGVLAALGTMYRPVVVGGLMLVWRWITGRMAPQHRDRAPAQTVTVTTLGGAGAMALAIVIQEPSLRFLFAIVAVIAAVALSKRETTAPGTPVLLLVGAAAVAAVAAVIAGAEAAFADDGGWKECGSSLQRWWSCTGSDRARWLAAFGAGGSAFGSGIGSGLVPSGPPEFPKPWSEMSPDEREGFIQDYINRYKDTHPNATPEQLQRFIEGLRSQPPGFWENRYEDWKNFLSAYWDDVSSGKQAEGLGGMFYGMYEGFSGAASKTWDEMKQLPATLSHLPGAIAEDFAAGGPGQRMQGMLDAGGAAIEMADRFVNMSPEERQAVYDKYGKENIDRFMSKMGEFERSLANADPTEIRRKIGELAGMAEFEVLIGAGGDKGMKLTKEGLDFIKEARLLKHMDESVTGLRGTAKGVQVPKLSDDLLFERHNLLEMAKNQPVKITPEEADRLFGIDEKVLLERQGTILQYGEGKATKGGFTQYKLGDENAILAKELRTQHPDIWTGKWNPVGDKSYVPGEEAFMSADDLARFRDHPPLPGETVNYTPTKLSQSEYDALSPDLQSRYNDRMKDAAAWDHYTGFDSRKVVDYSDPTVRAKYGEMYVPEDPGSPVAKAEFWKDPDDNRVYVRYQTKDGTWSEPRRQASDLDTVTHGGGEKLTYDQSRTLQYKQSDGQIGEGDTPAWTRSMLQEGPDGYQLADPEMKDMLYKAIDALHKADGQPVIEQTLDGYVLKTASYAELDMAKDAAAKLDATGAWTPEQRASLVGKGILPPR